MPPTRRPTPTWRCRSSAPTDRRPGLCHRDGHGLGRRSRASPTRSCGWSRRSSRAATSPACAETRQRRRGLARLAARPCLRQCPPAADLDAEPRPHDPALGGLGGAGAGRAFRRRRRCSSARPKARRRSGFSLHVGDVGHTLVVGPTGAGKSVLLALMALQFRRYPGAQVFAFDFGGSIRAAALAMGGDWHDLGGALSRRRRRHASRSSRSPRIDDAAERAWAADWIVAILAREGVAITPEVKEHLWSALTSLASAPVGERTLTGLAVLLQSNDLKQALQPYCIGGPYGRLLDAESRAARRGRGPGLRDRGADRHRRRARRARLSLPSHRGPARWPADAAHRRRRLARARRRRLRRRSCANG